MAFALPENRVLVLDAVARVSFAVSQILIETLAMRPSSILLSHFLLT